MIRQSTYKQVRQQSATMPLLLLYSYHDNHASEWATRTVYFAARHLGVRHRQQPIRVRIIHVYLAFYTIFVVSSTKSLFEKDFSSLAVSILCEFERVVFVSLYRIMAYNSRRRAYSSQQRGISTSIYVYIYIRSPANIEIIIYRFYGCALVQLWTSRWVQVWPVINVRRTVVHTLDNSVFFFYYY